MSVEMPLHAMKVSRLRSAVAYHAMARETSVFSVENTASMYTRTETRNVVVHMEIALEYVKFQPNRESQITTLKLVPHGQNVVQLSSLNNDSKRKRCV